MEAHEWKEVAEKGCLDTGVLGILAVEVSCK